MNMTKQQMERQDTVDNAIFSLIQEINPTDKEIDWNIELIGEIRDVLENWFVEKLNLCDESTFYPHAEVEI
jgi:DNA polymerase sigma